MMEGWTSAKQHRLRGVDNRLSQGAGALLPLPYVFSFSTWYKNKTVLPQKPTLDTLLCLKNNYLGSDNSPDWHLRQRLLFQTNWTSFPSRYLLLPWTRLRPSHHLRGVQVQLCDRQQLHCPPQSTKTHQSCTIFRQKQVLTENWTICNWPQLCPWLAFPKALQRYRL